MFFDGDEDRFVREQLEQMLQRLGEGDMDFVKSPTYQAHVWLSQYLEQQGFEQVDAELISLNSDIKISESVKESMDLVERVVEKIAELIWTGFQTAKLDFSEESKRELLIKLAKVFELTL